MRYKLPEIMKNWMLDDVAFLPLGENASRQIESLRRSHGAPVFLANIWRVLSRTARRDIIKVAVLAFEFVTA